MTGSMCTGSRNTIAAVLMAACVGVAIAVVGCSPPTNGRVPAGGTQESAGTGGAGADFGGRETDVLMMGRSVMGSWFSHWGHDGGTPVERHGRRLLYREIEGPEGIARSASEAIGEVPAGTTVFFKFCFVDFAAPDAAGARDELERNKGYVLEVIDAAEARGVQLIIGNALPNVASQTNRYLVDEHRDYNAWLDEVAGEHPDTVRVFDQYSVLADDDGALKAAYAISRDDAHLNERAYDALDAAFFDFLDRG